MQKQIQFILFVTVFVVLLLESSQVMAEIEVQQGQLLEKEEDLYLCSISPDGSYAAIGGETTQIIKVFNTSTGALTGTITLPAGIETEDVELSNSGKRVYVGGQGNGAFSFDKYGTLDWSRPDIPGSKHVGTTPPGNVVFVVDIYANFYRLSGADGSNLIPSVPIDSRGWTVKDVNTAVDGSRVLIRTNSDIIITDGFGNETHFYDVITGNGLIGAHLSPDGSHFVVSYQDPDTMINKISLYEIGVGEKWTKQVQTFADVKMDDHNWIYVCTYETDAVAILYNNAGSEITHWSTRGTHLDVADDGSRCVIGLIGGSGSTYVYDFIDAYECYPDLHMQAYITDVVPYDADTQQYTLTIANWYHVPPELFVASPELPPCGLNDQAGRTYIRIKGNEGTSYFNGCGARGDGTSSEFLKNLSFLVDDTDPLDPYIYLEMWDRKCDQYLYSTYAFTGKACPVGDLDGDCIVNLLDFTLMAENWLVDNN